MCLDWEYFIAQDKQCLIEIYMYISFYFLFSKKGEPFPLYIDLVT